MRVPALAAGLLAALLVTAAAAADPPRSGVVHVPRNPSLVEQGYQLYGGNCVSCHGSRGEGILAPAQGARAQKGLGPRLRGVGAQSADFYLRTGYMPLESALDQPTRRHSPFTTKQIDALVAYVS